jgi:hypothetical protein
VAAGKRHTVHIAPNNTGQRDKQRNDHKKKSGLHAEPRNAQTSGRFSFYACQGGAGSDWELPFAVATAKEPNIKLKVLPFSSFFR